MKAIVPPLAALALITAAHAADTAPAPRLLNIGSTGISCVMAPCPWRGIVAADDERRDPLRPLWSGEAPPRLVGSDEDVARIERAWHAMECLQVEGAIAAKATADTAPTVRVQRIVGGCA